MRMVTKEVQSLGSMAFAVQGNSLLPAMRASRGYILGSKGVGVHPIILSADSFADLISGLESSKERIYVEDAPPSPQAMDDGDTGVSDTAFRIFMSLSRGSEKAESYKIYDAKKKIISNVGTWFAGDFIGPMASGVTSIGMGGYDAFAADAAAELADSSTPTDVGGWWEALKDMTRSLEAYWSHKETYDAARAGRQQHLASKGFKAGTSKDGRKCHVILSHLGGDHDTGARSLEFPDIARLVKAVTRT
ncbi:hypothetical protein NX02_18535 [Sphingomonas sanxanigenens DSM 19645 = NX02]|uniref:Uncharacterized protein n=2 Tax=Sphingomonas sanxanigenens TaxID=397260 RepID=W0AE59_9SPHN|nr:hypothetical protein NX02_18535 [Sphingomonas sanxanigenens DSM 19645 = NX02]